VTHDSDADRMQVIDRILYKLDELVRPFVHKILVVIEPLLIDEDYYARVEGAAPGFICRAFNQYASLSHLHICETWLDFKTASLLPLLWCAWYMMAGSLVCPPTRSCVQGGRSLPTCPRRRAWRP